jgi:hypothetical protein
LHHYRVVTNTLTLNITNFITITVTITITNTIPITITITITGYCVLLASPASTAW